jgi:dienelactone hydrolase
MHGPAGGIYDRLSKRLLPNAASLQLDYRRPGQLMPCIADVLTGIEYLKRRQHRGIILVGHSFGGAVVIAAAVRSPSVIGVVALSSQTYGARDVAQVSPRPILFAHGEQDEILPPECSISLYRQAREPKTLKLYRECRHGLDDCRQQLERDSFDWMSGVLTSSQPKSSASWLS